jgi:hypothetical protein
MPPVQWPLYSHRPSVEIVFPQSRGKRVRRLIADTGAGDGQSTFQLVLMETDCVSSKGVLVGEVQLGGAYSGQFRVYLVKIEIPLLGFADDVPVVGVPRVPHGFDGIAAFRFLNRFQYGNFGNPDQFGVE